MVTMSSTRGDERYTFTTDKTIHKVQLDGHPDRKGAEYHLVSELDDGYIVYVEPVDPSQPSPNFFIHKRYFI